MNYERAWEAVGPNELKYVLQLKSTISTKHNQIELVRALHYFEKYIYDFPGEFFLQTPFIFMVSNILNVSQTFVKYLFSFCIRQTMP